MDVNGMLEMISGEDDIARMELMVPTDILHIRDVVKVLPNVLPSTRRSLLVWMQALLRNPFDVSHFMSNAELNDLKLFLLDSLRCLDHRLRKVAIRATALLVNSVSHEGKVDELYSMSTGEFLLLGQMVSEVDFYGFLKQLSKIGSVPRRYVEFSESDHAVIRRYKIKILSHSCAAPVSDMKKLMEFINEDDSRLGWTLSKSMYRLSRYLDRHNLVLDLKSLISRPIFGDEQLWVNVISLLSFFAFDGHDIGDVRIVAECLLYDKEFVPRSTNVREAALFLHWCLLRSFFSIDDAIHRIVFVSLFDRELVCRRAAASVVQEYIGRAQGNGDLAGTIDLVQAQDSSNGVLCIDPASVKRPESCLRIFCAIEQKQPYEQMVFALLCSFTRASRELAAEIIARFYDPLDAPLRYKTVNEMDGLHLLIANALKMVPRDGSSSSLCNDLRERFGGTVSGFILTPQMYRMRNMHEAVRSYLLIGDITDPEPFKKNVLFLISRGFDPELVSGAMGSCVQDPDFSRAILSTITKNPSGILANSRNHPSREQCIRRFLGNLKSGVHTNYIIRALSEMEAYTSEVVCAVKNFLDDYTVDVCGDSGYFNRREALFYFLKLRSKTQVPGIAIEPFVIRFMADKSKRLREDVLKALLSANYARFKHDFGYIYGTTSYCQPALALDSNCASKIEQFFLAHAMLSKDHSNEEAYFTALFGTFFDNKHFHYGIINTINTSDKRLFGTILGLINSMKHRFVSAALDFIKEHTLVYPSLRLLLALKEKSLVCRICTTEQAKLSQREKDLLDKIMSQSPNKLPTVK